MSNEYQTVLWIVLGFIFALIMLSSSCTYTVNVVQSKGSATDAIDDQPTNNVNPTIPISV